MKKNILKLIVVLFVILTSAIIARNTFAEDQNVATSISLTPVSKILQLASNSVYDETFTVNNDGETSIKIEVYAAPYSYVYSNEENLYKLGFSNENNFTQISRWITFKDTAGNYVEKTVFSIGPQTSLDIAFRISTPNNIPNGGQYAVIFAHTLSEATSGSGIRTEASPGMVVYGRSSEGEATVEAEISSLSVMEEDGNVVSTAKVKNSGNVDFNAAGTLKIEPIIGFGSYNTDPESPIIRYLSVIPETELVISDVWEDAPGFGIYKATWEVTAGEKSEKIEKLIVRIPIFVIIITIILLTILIAWIIITVRKRKERRSRLAV